MAELVKEGKTRFISLSECSAESLRRGNAVQSLVSLQMEYSLFSRDAEEQGQLDACKELDIAMMAYAVLGRGMLSAHVPRVEEMPADDVRAQLPRFEGANLDKNLRLRSALEAIAQEEHHDCPARHCLANRAGLTCGSLCRADTWREVAQSHRVECARRGYCAHGRRSSGNRPHRPARRRIRHSLSDRTNAPAEFMRPES
jgi:hypothetical protein